MEICEFIPKNIKAKFLLANFGKPYKSKFGCFRCFLQISRVQRLIYLFPRLKRKLFGKVKSSRLAVQTPYNFNNVHLC